MVVKRINDNDFGNNDRGWCEGEESLSVIVDVLIND